jgi:hypothetical protein
MRFVIMLSVLFTGGFRAKQRLVVPTPTPDLPRSPSTVHPQKLNRSQRARLVRKAPTKPTTAAMFTVSEVKNFWIEKRNITAGHDGRKIVVEKNDIGGVLAI